MADEPKPDTPIARALKKRRKLQAEIQRAMQELEETEKFISLHRHFSIDEEEAKGESPPAPPILGKAGHGQTQAVFERLVLDVLRGKGRPMRSSEIVDAFRERGHPLGGNETRTAWNRLWQAKDRGILMSVPHFGYWPADEPLPDNLESLAPPKKKRRPPGPSMREERRGKRKGREPFLNDAKKEEVLSMFARGMSGPQIAIQFGVSTATIYDVKNKWRKKPEKGNQ